MTVVLSYRLLLPLVVALTVPSRIVQFVLDSGDDAELCVFFRSFCSLDRVDVSLSVHVHVHVHVCVCV